jgi:hypothetical protein
MPRARSRNLAGILKECLARLSAARDGKGIEEVPFLSPVSPGHNQAGTFEDPEMLHDPEPRHSGKGSRKLKERLAILNMQLVHQDATAHVR